MKRFYVIDNDTNATGQPQALLANQLGIYKLTSAGYVVQATAPATTVKELYLAAGNAAGVTMPFHDIGLMSLKDISVTQTKYKAATKVEVIIDVTTSTAPFVDRDYTIFISRADTVQNQRWRQTVTYRTVEGDTWDIVFTELTKRINALTKKTGLTATFTAAVPPTGARITIMGTTVSPIVPYGITAGDTLHGAVLVTTVSRGISAIGDVEDIKARFFEAAQTRGADNTYWERNDLYPFLNVSLGNTQYDIYTFRFYNPRLSQVTVDEPLFQLVHLAVKTGGTVATRLNTVFANYIR